jgi:hypothetical protein
MFFRLSWVQAYYVILVELNHIPSETIQVHAMISGFCHDVDDICALLGYCAVLSGKGLPLDTA